MPELFSQIATILSDAENVANGVGTAFKVRNFKHTQIVISTSGLAGGETAVIKCMGALPTDGVEPTWSSAATLANPHYKLQMVNKDTGVTVDGSVGYTVGTTDEVTAFEVNTNGEDFINLEISSVSGTFKVKAIARSWN